MKHYNVVIVGGGPAGASLGFLLQRAGISNCIIDKKTFPRDKLCGGLLTKKTVNLLREIYHTDDFTYERISTSLELFLGMQELSSVITESCFVLVERRDFDNDLIKKYKSIGGMLLEERQILKVNIERKCLILDNKEDIQYDFLIGADGANSQIRKLIDKKYQPNALCIEANCQEQNINDNISIYFSTIKNGYAWCFPKKDYYTVGIGGTIKQNKKMRESFLCFTNDINKSIEIKKIRGALIPFGQYVKKPYSNNIILVGDAAGLVDPITGEGIYFALRSAQYAYEAICEFMISGLSVELNYAKKIKKIHLIINDANWFNRIFFNRIIKKFILKILHGHKRIIQYFCENVLADYKILYMTLPIKYAIIMFSRKLKNKKNTF